MQLFTFDIELVGLPLTCVSDTRNRVTSSHITIPCNPFVVMLPGQSNAGNTNWILIVSEVCIWEKAVLVIDPSGACHSVIPERFFFGLTFLSKSFQAGEYSTKRLPFRRPSAVAGI